MALTFYPYEHSMRGVVNQAMNEILHSRGGHYPYWGNVPHHQSLNYGSPLGAVVNTAVKFAFTVDVSHFKPCEIKVTVTGNELTIEGNHEEKNDQHGTIQRSFIRKYLLPEDINLQAIRTNLTEHGHLTIEAPKKTLEATQSRAIPITITAA